MVAAVMFAPVAVPPMLATIGMFLGVFGFALFVAMQISRSELKRFAVVAVALVLLFGLFVRLSADTVVNDPVVALCRALDAEDNWILYWLYDCADVLRNAGR
jgi:hypothetical protein